MHDSLDTAEIYWYTIHLFLVNLCTPNALACVQPPVLFQKKKKSEDFLGQPLYRQKDDLDKGRNSTLYALH